jgi:hypothetical protein
MLKVLPPPDAADKAARSERIPMTRRNKQVAIGRYGFGVVIIITLYAALTTLRDFRDNFFVEIWREIDPSQDYSIFASLETAIGVVVLLGIGAMCFVKGNLKAYILISSVFFFSFLCIGVSTYYFRQDTLSPVWWMLLVGVGLFFPYLLIQIAFFERIIGLFKIKGNVGYFVYLCDSFGYLGSVGMLVYKEFFATEVSWAKMLLEFASMVALFGFVLSIFQLAFFGWKYIKKSLANTVIA